ncbi:DsrE family protein, partial [Pseudoalteromonas sp. S1688]|uniref:DsrE family protein n=1 Tax=Pseudoalteromonas sp. S1688 TaxID=579511 RepID=UPI00110A6673
MRHAVDLTRSFAGVDQNISLLFLGPAVLARKINHKPNRLGSKDFFDNFKLVEIYDVEKIYGCEKALIDYGLSKSELVIEAN